MDSRADGMPSTHDERNELRAQGRLDRMFPYLVGGAIGILGAIGIGYLSTPEQSLAERQSLETSRQESRQRVQDTNLREDRICVVCMTNAREIILLPCGHVCLCRNCSIQINDNCPICRKSIHTKALAYIA